MKRVLAAAVIAVVALASCALPMAVAFADEPQMPPAVAETGLVGEARAAFVKKWTDDIVATNPDASTKGWIFEDTGENFAGGPVINVIVPGSHACLVVLVPGDHTVFRMIGCAATDGAEKSKQGT